MAYLGSAKTVVNGCCDQPCILEVLVLEPGAGRDWESLALGCLIKIETIYSGWNLDGSTAGLAKPHRFCCRCVSLWPSDRLRA